MVWLIALAACGSAPEADDSCFLTLTVRQAERALCSADANGQLGSCRVEYPHTPVGETATARLSATALAGTCANVSIDNVQISGDPTFAIHDVDPAFDGLPAETADEVALTVEYSPALAASVEALLTYWAGAEGAEPIQLNIVLAGDSS